MKVSFASPPSWLPWLGPLLAGLAAVAVVRLWPEAGFWPALLAALILVTVAASVRRVTIRATRGNALVTGALSGLTGTSAAVGGPFSALLFQHEPPDRLRDTLAVSFLLGSLISVIGLVPAGELTWADLVASLVWSPFVWIGYAVSGPARRRLDAARLRVLVLAFCVVAALVLIGRALLT